MAQDSDYPVSASPEDFVFCYIDDNSFHHFVPKAGASIISMFTDYEGGGAISVINDFMLMSFSFDFVFTVGTLYDVEKVQEENNPKPVKSVEGSGVTFQKFEVWSPSGSAAKEAGPATSLKVNLATTQSTQSAGADQDSLISSSVEVKHPWYNSLVPFVNYRTNPVFMVPAHLTLQ